MILNHGKPLAMNYETHCQAVRGMGENEDRTKSDIEAVLGDFGHGHFGGGGS